VHPQFGGGGTRRAATTATNNFGRCDAIACVDEKACQDVADAAHPRVNRLVLREVTVGTVVREAGDPARERFQLAKEEYA
jgi:hypothetical protein